MNEKDLLAVTRGGKHIKLLGLTTVIGLLASSSVYAADDSSTFLNLGIPSWVWVLIVLALLIGVTMLPKKWIEPKQDKKPENKAPAPVAKAPIAEAKPEIPKAVAPAVVAPVVTATPPAAPIIESSPKEIQPPKPVEVDALDEARQFLSQQRFPQAVGILNKGLQKDPHRSDLMLELLEVYLKQGDHEAFDAQFEQLKQLDDPFALIQAEELHNQLVRPIVVEESDHIEFDSSKAVIPEPEPEVTAPSHDYATDSLDFTSAKTQADDLTPEDENAVIEHDFSLDKIDLKTVSDEKESHADVAEKSTLDEFDFSAFDLKVPEASKSEEPEPVPVSPKIDLLAPATESEAKVSTDPISAPLIDLDFDFDDSFAIDEDKQEIAKSEKSSWTTELADENFASPSTAPVAEKTLGEIIKGDGLSSLEEEFPFLQSVDTFQTRLDLARSYITLGEIDSARELLNEVAEQGASAQQTEARELIAKLAS